MSETFVRNFNVNILSLEILGQYTYCRCPIIFEFEVDEKYNTLDVLVHYKEDDIGCKYLIGLSLAGKPCDCSTLEQFQNHIEDVFSDYDFELNSKERLIRYIFGVLKTVLDENQIR